MQRRSFLKNSLSALGLSGTFASTLLAETNLDPELRLRAMEDKPLRTIAFGSCNKISLDQSYWKLIGRDNPDLWIWLGDNIYADNTTLPQRRKLYDLLRTHPLYQDFCQRTPVIATWDDHDYGSNNDDGSFVDKEESKQIFLDWLGYDQASDLRRQSGVYQSQVFGPPGQRTEVIMLDLRYNMNQSLFNPILLGEEQWRWFEATVRNSTADLIVIGTSLNVTSPVASVMIGLEGWNKYPTERARLYNLLMEREQPVVLLSGDRHFAELTRHALPNGKVVHEVMSSGLTHAVGVKLPNPGRMAEMVGTKNYGLLQIDWSSSGRPLVKAQIASAESYRVLRDVPLV